MRFLGLSVAGVAILGSVLALTRGTTSRDAGQPEALRASNASAFSAQADPKALASNLRAIHRAGQTFLTWQEWETPPVKPGISASEMRDLRYQLEQKSRVRYRVYRSASRITSVAGLTPIADVPPLTIWNAEHYGLYPQPQQEALRYIIEEGQPALAAGTGLYVHNPAAAGPAFYAVTLSVNGRENPIVTESNSLAAAVEETVGVGVPVLQRQERPESFLYVVGPVTLKYYVRWEAPPNFSVESTPFDYVIGIPPNPAKPAPVMLGLHAWGGSLTHDYGWWYNAEKGAMLVATNMRPYDWWAGFHERLFTADPPKTPQQWQRGVVRPYPQRRVLSFLDWVGQNYPIDASRSFVAGNSMGGSGSIMLALRFPERFAWVMSWVGIHRPTDSPTFKASYEEVFGKPEFGVKFEDGTPVWEYFDDIKYARSHPERDFPLLVFSNGKNDANIGWPPAVEFVRALQETHQPHLFVWGQNSHGERVGMPGGDQRIMPIDIRIDQSLPAFTRGSLDGNPGNGSPEDGDPAGQINAYMLWETKDIVDEAERWEMTIGLFPNAPAPTATVDVTPRRCQRFRLKPGENVAWTNTSLSGPKVAQSGVATADKFGFVTLPAVETSKGKSRIRIQKSDRAAR